MKQKIKRAFTLLELVIVIAVLSILALVVVPSFALIKKNSDLSTDNDEVLSLNFALAMYESDYGIFTEQDLKKAIIASKGENAFYSLQPLSASYGYHFWYRVKTNKVILATTNEIITDYHDDIATEFSTSLRASLIDGFILLDRLGSGLAEGLSAIDDLLEGRSTDVKASYQTAVTNFYALDKGEAKDSAVQSKTTVNYLEKTAIVTNDGTLRYSGLDLYVTNLVFAKGINKVSSTLFDYASLESGEYLVSERTLIESEEDPYLPMQDTTTNAVVTVNSSEMVYYDLLPSITQVETNSLWFNMKNANTVTLKLDEIIDSKEDLVSLFEPSATNAQIYLNSNGDVYTINKSDLVLNGETVALLGNIQKVNNFELGINYGDAIVDTIEDKVKLVYDDSTDTYKLYVAGEYQQEINLVAKNIQPENATSKKIIFTSEDDSLVSSTTAGVLTVKMPKSETYQTTVKATALAGGLTKNVNVQIIRVNSARLGISNSDTSENLFVNESALTEIGYVYKDDEFNELSFGDLTDFTYNTTYEGINCNQTLTIVQNSISGGENGVTLKKEEGVYKIVINPELFGDRTITFTVKIGNELTPYIQKQFTLNISDERVEAFEHRLRNTETTLYRVGNQNAIALDTLFVVNDELSGIALNVSYAVLNAEHDNIKDNYSTEAQNGFSATYSNSFDGIKYKEQTIKFTGTGIAKIQLTHGEKNIILMVEVVNGYNVTNYSELKNRNSVLLSDITMPSGGSYYLSNATLYGNGFTFDTTAGRYTNKGMISENYVISIDGATINNLQIVGAVYPEYGVTADSNYNNALIYSVGNSVIANSYLSNCATPVRVNGGNLYITNSTLKGGTFANLDIRSNSVVTVNNLTTINQTDSNDKYIDANGNESIPVGLGIVLYYEGVSNDARINVEGTLKQYNHVCEADGNAIENQYSGNTAISNNITNVINKIFGADFADYQYTDSNSVVWVNTGILALSPPVDSNAEDSIDEDIRINYPGKDSVYMGKSISYTFIEYIFDNRTFSGYLCAPTKNVEPATATAYESIGQYAIKPDYSFEHTETLENGRSEYNADLDKVMIFANSNLTSENSLTWKASTLIAKKFGIDLSYTISLPEGVTEGVLIGENNNIIFTNAGEYQIVYSFTDPYNYTYELNRYSVEYNNQLVVTVKVVTGENKASFAFGESNAQTQTINGKNYAYPENGTDLNGDGIKEYTIEMIMSDNSTPHLFPGWYAYFPVLNGVLINDNDNIYNSETTVMPEGLSVVGDVTELFKYQSASSAESAPVLYDYNDNDKYMLCFKSAQISANRVEFNAVIEYIYTDLAGYTTHYFINYHAPAQEYSAISCFTAETLVTLANGSKKAVSQLEKTDKILTWDFFKGEYVAQDIALLVNHGKCAYSVVNLTFDGNNQLEIIGDHGVFDYDLNKFVYLNATNATKYIGHRFVKQGNAGEYQLVKLVSVSVSEKITEAWSITSCVNSNAIAGEMLTLAPPKDFYNWIAMGEKMRYDIKQFESDINTYGLYSYDTFKDLVTYEQFIAFNGAYLKIPIEKGIFSFEYLKELIKSYL